MFYRLLLITLLILVILSPLTADESVQDAPGEETQQPTAAAPKGEDQGDAETIIARKRQAYNECKTTQSDCSKQAKSLSYSLWYNAWNGFYRHKGSTDPETCRRILPWIDEARTVHPALKDYFPAQMGAECLMNLGFSAFAAENYAEALDHFSRVKSFADIHPGVSKKWAKLSTIGDITDTIQLLQQTPQSTPVINHRILSVFVTKTAATQTKKNGAQVTCSAESDPQIFERIKRQEKATALYYRAITGGRLSLQFENRIFSGAITRFTKSTIDDSSFEPDLDTILAGTAPHFDTYVFYVKSPAPCGTDAMGGLSRRVLIAGKKSTPIRGYINLHQSYTQTYYWSIYLHEFFHVIAGIAKIDGHGYLKDRRRKFPDWTGKTADQHDFRKWFMQQLIAEHEQMAQQGNAAASRFSKLLIRQTYPAGE